MTDKQAAPQGADHDIESAIESAIAARRAAREIYGVKTSFITTADFEDRAMMWAMQPAEDAWARTWDELDTVEKQYFIERADEYLTAGGIKAAFSEDEYAQALAAMAEEKLEQLHRVYSGTQTDHADLVTPKSALKDGVFKYAWDAGKDAYTPPALAQVFLTDSLMDAEKIISNFVTGMDRADMTLPDISPLAVKYFILEHELAHIGGADESQADLIAAVRYMRTTGRDDMPRLMRELRKIGSINNGLNVAMANKKLEEADTLCTEKNVCLTPELKQEFNDQIAHDRRYGWGQVDALSWAIDTLGIDGAKDMAEDDIIELRWRKFDNDNPRSEALAETLVSALAAIGEETTKTASMHKAGEALLNCVDKHDGDHAACFLPDSTTHERLKEFISAARAFIAPADKAAPQTVMPKHPATTVNAPRPA